MKKLICLGALLLILALAGCASVPEGRETLASPRDRSANFNWGSDAVCSPGCPAGMSGSW